MRRMRLSEAERAWRVWLCVGGGAGGLVGFGGRKPVRLFFFLEL